MKLTNPRHDTDRQGAVVIERTLDDTYSLIMRLRPDGTNRDVVIGHRK